MLIKKMYVKIVIIELNVAECEVYALQLTPNILK
jgi:hypothetical protein